MEYISPIKLNEASLEEGEIPNGALINLPDSSENVLASPDQENSMNDSLLVPRQLFATPTREEHAEDLTLHQPEDEFTLEPRNHWQWTKYLSVENYAAVKDAADLIMANQLNLDFGEIEQQLAISTACVIAAQREFNADQRSQEIHFQFFDFLKNSRVKRARKEIRQLLLDNPEMTDDEIKENLIANHKFVKNAIERQRPPLDRREIERSAKKEAKKAEKAQKASEEGRKAAEKAARKEEEAAKKAAKQAEKEAAKAAKEAQKAADKAAKEAARGDWPGFKADEKKLLNQFAYEIRRANAEISQEDLHAEAVRKLELHYDNQRAKAFAAKASANAFIDMMELDERNSEWKTRHFQDPPSCAQLNNNQRDPSKARYWPTITEWSDTLLSHIASERGGGNTEDNLEYLRRAEIHVVNLMNQRLAFINGSAHKNKEIAILSYGSTTDDSNNLFHYEFNSIETVRRMFDNKKTWIIDRESVHKLQSNDSAAAIPHKGIPQIYSKTVTLFDIWYRHPCRRVYEGSTFAPSFRPPATDRVKDRLNRWTGMVFDPERAEKLFDKNGKKNWTWEEDDRNFIEKFEDWTAFYNISPILSHMRYNWCASDEEFYFVLGWMSSMLKNPEKKTDVCMVVAGSEGAGKTGIFEFFMKLFGTQHATLITNMEDALGQFNTVMKDKVFVCLDEAFFSKNHVQANILKNLITGTTIRTGEKFCNATIQQNYCNFAICTNHREHAFPASNESRRFMSVLPDLIGMLDKCSPYELLFQKNPKEYFDILQHSMKGQLPSGFFNQEGLDAAAQMPESDIALQAFGLFLYKLDIQAWSHRKIPVTYLTYINKLSSRTGFERWWYDALCKGGFNFNLVTKEDQNATAVIWLNKVDSNTLHQVYMKSNEFKCKDAGESYVAFKEKVTTILRDLPLATKPLALGHNVKTGEPLGYSEQWILPSLELCRGAMNELMPGASLGWNSDESNKEREEYVKSRKLRWIGVCDDDINNVAKLKKLPNLNQEVARNSASEVAARLGKEKDVSKKIKQLSELNLATALEYEMESQFPFGDHPEATTYPDDITYSAREMKFVKEKNEAMKREMDEMKAQLLEMKEMMKRKLEEPESPQSPKKQRVEYNLRPRK